MWGVIEIGEVVSLIAFMICLNEPKAAESLDEHLGPRPACHSGPFRLTAQNCLAEVGRKILTLALSPYQKRRY